VYSGKLIRELLLDQGKLLEVEEEAAAAVT
jgi:hypothetical protein